ncbi:MAG: electron transfer flavoprotein subunit beta/FixA family protein [Kiritimatiellae bacterium]|nr:electron transfer flavoprotein subunit beta/FixA family protein [Kiritimatiellia bacterium]
MRVVVCVKQVPDTTNVRINPKTNTLMREGVESIVNPFDEYALEEALRLKDQAGARVTVVSMGPPQAMAVLREALARGADDAYLVSSRAFGGADTLATSYTLAMAIKKACGGRTPDLVLFGKQAIDGDTAQVGPGVSEFLGVPLITYVKEIAMGGGAGAPEPPSFAVTTIMDDGEHVIEGRLPAVMTVLKEAATPRFAPLAGAMRAAKSDITVLDEKDIAADPIRIGLKGSPTKVVTIFPPPVKGGGEKVDARGDAAAGAKAVADFLAKKGLVK